MRVWKVEGYQNMDYVSKKTGKPVRGTSVFVSSEAVAPAVGRQFYKAWLSPDVDYFPHVGDEVFLSFNQFGGLDDIALV